MASSHSAHVAPAATRPVQAPSGFNAQARAVALGDVVLESGRTLPDVVMTYECWGELNDDASNVVLVEHALTGDSHVVGDTGDGQPTPGWWPGIIGPGAALDTDEYFVVAINVLGGCRGSTGPISLAPDGEPWGGRFPQVTVRDQVRAEVLTLVVALAGLAGNGALMNVAIETAPRNTTQLPTLIELIDQAAAAGISPTQLAQVIPDPDTARDTIGGDYTT